MKKTLTINLIAPLLFILSLYLGFSGLVDWWVIALIWISKFELNVSHTF
jgi:hypothetical protein